VPPAARERVVHLDECIAVEGKPDRLVFPPRGVVDPGDLERPRPQQRHAVPLDHLRLRLDPEEGEEVLDLAEAGERLECPVCHVRAVHRRHLSLLPHQTR
jgi:hypothetical protein